jgi:hypothetical protein
MYVSIGLKLECNIRDQTCSIVFLICDNLFRPVSVRIWTENHSIAMQKKIKKLLQLACSTS